MEQGYSQDESRLKVFQKQLSAHGVDADGMPTDPRAFTFSERDRRNRFQQFLARIEPYVGFASNIMSKLYMPVVYLANSQRIPERRTNFIVMGLAICIGMAFLWYFYSLLTLNVGESLDPNTYNLASGIHYDETAPSHDHAPTI